MLYRSVVTVSTSENTKSLGLGATKSYSKQIGMAFVKNSKQPISSRKEIRILSSSRLKRPGQSEGMLDLYLSDVCKHRGLSPQVLRQLTTESSKIRCCPPTTLTAVNLVCAAIVDQTNSKILYEFK